MAEGDNPQGGNDPTQAFQSRLTKMNGDAMAFATQLFDENFRLREDKRALDAQLTEAKSKVPADGAVVLKPEEARDYEEYKALGKPKELKDRIEAHETLESEVKDLKKKDLLREVADLHGYKLSVLLDRDKAAGGLEIEIKTDKDKRKAAFVKDGDKETPLTEYAEANWADYLPSLKAEQASPEPRTRQTGHVADPRPKAGNGKEAYEHSRTSLASSGKYGM